MHPLSNEVQTSSVNDILVNEFDKDNTLDVFMIGNLYGSEVETPRNDASYGMLLVGEGDDDYELLENYKVNLWAGGDIKDAAFINVGGTKAILLAKNNDYLQLIKIN
ncbi:hypothetical protein [Snuella lapsa]|uniref:Uncharacterized protein n=1 Tax=Snuella lapsa TaxID=870481 RepID=A0ABP6XMT7_9FLAO